jgi:sugar lactone lactonase YvrE
VLLVGSDWASLSAGTTGGSGSPTAAVFADLGDGARDGSASTRRARSDTGDVPNKRCVSVREVVSCWRRSTSTGGCFACSLGGPDRTTLFMLAAEWGGPERVRRNREPGEC